MTPDWQALLSALLVHYQAKTLARELGLSREMLDHIASGRRAVPKLPYAVGARILALYDLVAADETAELTMAQHAEWAGARVAKMQARPAHSKIRARRATCD